jgi:serine/threonine-protein kinase RsbW
VVSFAGFLAEFMGAETALTVPPGSAGVRQVAAAFDVFCAGQQVPPSVSWRLRVALDEVLSNIARHGDAGGTSIDVTFRRDGEVLEVTVADAGSAFDPLAQPSPDLTSPLESRAPGGLGIALLRSLIDEVMYQRTDRNVLVMRKRINASEAPEPM